MAKSRSLVWNVVFFQWIWGIFGSTAGHLLVVWWPAKLLKKLRFLRIQKPATWPSVPARKSWLKSTLFPKPQGIECFLRNFRAKRGWFGKWNKEVFVFPVKTSQFSPAPSVTGASAKPSRDFAFPWSGRSKGVSNLGYVMPFFCENPNRYADFPTCQLLLYIAGFLKHVVFFRPSGQYVHKKAGVFASIFCVILGTRFAVTQRDPRSLHQKWRQSGSLCNSN